MKTKAKGKMREAFRNDKVQKKNNKGLVHVVRCDQKPRNDKAHRNRKTMLGRVRTTTHKRFCTSFIIYIYT